MEIRAASWFDGERLHTTAVRLQVLDGRIAALGPDRPGPVDRELAFLCPSLVEAHAHLVLDGDERRVAARRGWLDQDDAALLAAAWRHHAAYRAVGVGLLTDAGDVRGVNHAIRERASTTGQAPRIRSAGRGLRQRGRYGSFIADEVVDAPSAIAAVDAAIADGADAVKVVLTGIIDFAAGQVKGRPQFSPEVLAAIVARAHASGRRVFAHCSGSDGIQLALDAGIDSIEHGFFVTLAQLRRMAEAGTAWVPTLAPVAFQRDQPDWAGWDAASVQGLERICADHATALQQGREAGVRILAGSDAGSHGVPHGQGLIDEIAHLAEALGGIAPALHAATRAPRLAWGLPGGRIALGEPADLAAYEALPDCGAEALRQACWLCQEGRSIAVPTALLAAPLPSAGAGA